MFHGRQCVVINAGGSPTKPNEGSHREPPFNSSSPTKPNEGSHREPSFNSSSPAEPISSSSPTKLIHTMSPEELKGEGMLLSTMQAFDEVQTEENPLAPTGVAATQGLGWALPCCVSDAAAQHHFSGDISCNPIHYTVDQLERIRLVITDNSCIRKSWGGGVVPQPN